MAPSESDESHEETIVDLLDLEVYTMNGVYVGRVEDVRIDFALRKASGLALTDVNHDIIPSSEDFSRKRGVMIPYRWVHSVGDVVIVTDVAESISPASSSGESSPLAE